MTEHEKVVLVMLNNPEKIWWFSYELMGQHTINGVTFFLGYETSARMTELKQNGVLADMQFGKYTVKRLIQLQA
jgi:hypothetical protein